MMKPSVIKALEAKPTTKTATNPTESDAESDTEDAGEWETVYGATTKHIRELVMAGGGAHAWHYIVHFDADGKQTQVFVARYSNGFKPEPVQGRLISGESEEDAVRLVPEGYQCAEDECFLAF